VILLRGVKTPYENNHKYINGILYKLCSDCNEWLPLNEGYYYKNKSSPDRFNPYCKEDSKKRTSSWNRTNQQQYKETRAEWYQENKDRLLEKQKYLDEQNKEQKEIYSQEYRKSDHGKEKYRGYNSKRKIKNHKITTEEWEDCKKYFNHRCAYCNLKIEDHYIKFKGKIMLGDFHKDHVDDEGKNDLSNCVPSCKSCNTSKHTSSIEDWYNENNESFAVERLSKIIKWLSEDYKLYIR
jgi:hypothetical protein